MYQQDYLQRKISELGLVLAKLLDKALNQKNNFTTSTNENYTSIASLLQIETDDLIALDDKQLIQIIETNEGFNVENIQAFANLLFALAKLNDNGNTQQKALLLKSKTLLQYLEKTAPIFSVERYLLLQKIDYLLSPS
jgi:hypothetical protein